MVQHMVRVTPVIALEWDIRRARRESTDKIDVDRDGDDNLLGLDENSC